MINKRILYIVNSLSIGSGVMSFIMNVYRNINSDSIKIDFIVATSVDLSYEEELKELGAEIYYIPIPKKINFRNFINYRKNIKNFFVEHKYDYDIIHSHVPTFNIFYFPIAKKAGIKHRIVHSHSTKSSSKTINRIRNYFLLITVKTSSNHFFACSKDAAIYLFGRKKYYNNKVHIVNNSIDTESFSFKESIRISKRKELCIENNFVLGHVGRFSYEKNHSFLLDVFYEVKKIRKDSILILVGDGILLNEIKNKAKKLGLIEDILFLGIRDDVNEIMQAMDILILPSLFEGLGIVSIEAQSLGIPCILSDRVPKEVDLTELVTHISLCEKAYYWAKQICQIDKTSFNKESYSTKIKNKNYDIRNQVNWLEKFYLNIDL